MSSFGWGNIGGEGPKINSVIGDRNWFIGCVKKVIVSEKMNVNEHIYLTSPSTSYFFLGYNIRIVSNLKLNEQCLILDPSGVQKIL